MRIIYFSLFFFISLGVNAFDTLRIHSKTLKSEALNHALFIKTEKSHSIDDILKGLRLHPESFSILDRANQGYSDKIVWVVLPITLEPATENFLIEIQNPHLDYIEGFFVRGDSAQQLGNPTGDELPFSSRSINHRNFLWRLPQTQQVESCIVVFRIEKLNSSLFLPITVWEVNTFHQHDTQLSIIYGIFFGILLIVILYSLGLGLILKQHIQFYYVGLITVSVFYFLIGEGFALQFLYPTIAGINGFMRLIILALSSIALILFSISFLNIKHHQPRVASIMQAIAWLLAFMIVVTPFIGQFYLEHSAFFVPFSLFIY